MEEFAATGACARWPPGTRLTHAEGLLSRHTSDAVIVLGRGDAATIMRGSAAVVWQAFAAPRTVAEVSELMAIRYGVAGADVGRDLGPFVDELLGGGLLTAHPSDPSQSSSSKAARHDASG